MKISGFVTRVAGTVVCLASLATAQTPSAAPGSDMNAALSPEVQEKIVLTDAQVKGFFDASDELRAVTKAAPPKVPADPARFARGLPTDEQSLAVIKKHGFKDITEYQRVGYNAAMAYNVLQQGGKEAIDKKMERVESRQKETMDRLRAQLTPEQFKLLESQAAKSLATARAMQEVPEGNIELMKKYGDRMKGLGK